MNKDVFSFSFTTTVLKEEEGKRKSADELLFSYVILEK